MSVPSVVDRWQPAQRDVVASVAVLLALAAVAAFAIWGMPPKSTTVAPSVSTTPALTAPAAREGGEDGD